MTGNIQFVRTPLLDVAFQDSGPSDGDVVFLLHGWPDDASTWDDIRPRLNHAGFRTIVPYLRGFGKTEFHNESTPRSGQITAFVSDLLDTADALDIGRFSLVGHDWGGRATYAAAALSAERLKACAVLGVGYRTPPGNESLPLMQAQNYWYQWFMRTALGKQQLMDNRKEFCKYLWQAWMREHAFSDATYEDACVSFDSPDWLEITLHSYQHRWGEAAGDERYAVLEERLQQAPFIHVPMLVLHGLQDPCNMPSTSVNREAWFKSEYARHGIEACGHFPQREQPGIVTDYLLPFLLRHA
jgi:pimeloyl-ACP methyl ester carboxylesterase